MVRSLALILLLSTGVAAAATDAAVGSPFDDELISRRTEARGLAGRAEAIVPLLGILDPWDELSDRAQLVRLLEDVAGDARQLADVRARATFLRAALAGRMGDRAAAKKWRSALGLVTSWWVVGPFDNDGRGGFGRIFGPEGEQFDEAKRYPGKERDVAWRRFPEQLALEGLVPLDAVLRPDRQVVGYAHTWVRAAHAVDAAIHLGSGGPVKVWVNGRLAHAHDVARPVRFDQDVAPVRLVAGWNRVLVKIAAAEAGWAFFFRLTAPDGSPLEVQVDRDHRGAVPDGRRERRLAAVSDLGASLRRAAVLNKDAAALRALGLYLHFVSPDDPEEKSALDALKRAASLAPSLAAYRLAATAATEQNEKRRLLEQALAPELTARATAFERARTLVELGDVYAHGRRERRAEELWREALQVLPGYFPATLRLADLAADRGLAARAQAMLDGLAGEAAPLAVLRAQAHLDERRGLRGRAEAVYRRLAALVADDLATLRALLSLGRGRGDVAAALAWLERMIEARPDLVSLLLDKADILDDAGRTEEAHATLEAALGLCPDEPRLLERDGHMLHRLGRDDEALARLRRSLELRPQQPDLRAYLRQIESERGPAAAGRSAEELARAWAVPVEHLLARRTAKSAGQGGAVDEDEARVLLDLSVTRVHANGLSEKFAQRVVEILDERGAREQGAIDIRYTPETQAVEVRAARVYKRAGEIVEATAETDRDLSEPWYGLYYDLRAQSIEFARLEPGDVLDIEYVISDVGQRNLFADTFGDLHALQEDLPRGESTYVLITPKARQFYLNQPKLPGLTMSEAERGDERIVTLRALDVPKVVAEPGMPGFTEVAAYVHVSTYRDWPEVAAWYRGLIGEQLQSDEAIRRTVREAIRGARDDRERIRRLYDWVVQKTRYVGLEFGLHGYKPYRVTQVFARKFGDCKDKAALLVAMLKEAGIASTMALVRTRRGGDLDPLPASLAPFDHALVYVPQYDLFLDGTAEFSGSDELPAQDQGVPALLVSDPRAAGGGAGRLVRTPVLPPERNRVRRDARIALAADGSARVRLRSEVAGEVAHQWREHYQSPGERSSRLEKAENAIHPGARVKEFRFIELGLERPVRLEADLEVPAWARRRGAGLEMLVLGHEPELLRSYARLSDRRHDLVLGFPWSQEENLTLELPAGMRLERLPEPRVVESPFGSFSLSVVRQGRVVTVSSLLTVRRHRIARGDYAAFRRFCLDVDAAVAQSLVIAHE